MISSEYDTDFKVLGICIVFVFLLISSVGLDDFEARAQGTYVTTNSTNATSAYNASSSRGLEQARLLL
jgi:hypothetical protein